MRYHLQDTLTPLHFTPLDMQSSTPPAAADKLALRKPSEYTKSMNPVGAAIAVAKEMLTMLYVVNETSGYDVTSPGEDNFPLMTDDSQAEFTPKIPTHCFTSESKPYSVRCTLYMDCTEKPLCELYFRPDTLTNVAKTTLCALWLEKCDLACMSPTTKEVADRIRRATESHFRYEDTKKGPLKWRTYTRGDSLVYQDAPIVVAPALPPVASDPERYKTEFPQMPGGMSSAWASPLRHMSTQPATRVSRSGKTVPATTPPVKYDLGPVVNTQDSSLFSSSPSSEEAAAGHDHSMSDGGTRPSDPSSVSTPQMTTATPTPQQFPVNGSVPTQSPPMYASPAPQAYPRQYAPYGHSPQHEPGTGPYGLPPPPTEYYATGQPPAFDRRYPRDRRPPHPHHYPPFPGYYNQMPTPGQWNMDEERLARLEMEISELRRMGKTGI